MNVQLRAQAVARIFDAIAWVILVVGGIGALIALAVGLFGGEGFNGFVLGVIMALGVAIYTAISWAGITLAAVVAGYIAARSHSE